MNHVHGAHGTASVVEHPFLLGTQVLLADFLLQLGDDKVNDRPSVLAMSLDRALREVMQMLRIEDIKLIESRIEEVVQSREKGQKDGEQAEAAEREPAAAAARGGFLVGGGLGCHFEISNGEEEGGEEEEKRGDRLKNGSGSRTPSKEMLTQFGNSFHFGERTPGTHSPHKSTNHNATVNPPIAAIRHG